ncbi:hypothetical protein C9374_006616 [Naegleria lovaniensis]|uniref:Uncharacterized protein n=1 Tax=Naegleria lovaniensis TaxID=51637 RepID=A0AA88KM33_NAELO|nr:uncharacterized protein C9374_006616 [Naegleria lovaniensis]KAG2379499.1 hypothetical protein C9374_006616 [Naegleria lovaniensis]
MWARLYNLFNRFEEERKLKGDSAIRNTEDDYEWAEKYPEHEASLKPVDKVVAEQLEAFNVDGKALTTIDNSVGFYNVASLDATPYSVENEQNIQDKIHKIIDVLQEKTDIDFSNPSVALEKLRADLWDPSKTAENSYWGVVSKELNINPRGVVLAIPPELFNNTIGRGDSVIGGWYDAAAYDPKVRELWLKQGLTVQFEKPMVSKLQGNQAALFGQDAAKRLIEQKRKGTAYHYGFLRNKMGSKVFVGTLIGFTLWGLTLRFNVQNWRDWMYQRTKFVERLYELDEIGVATPQSEKLDAAHREWLTHYYEDEE